MSLDSSGMVHGYRLDGFKEMASIQMQINKAGIGYPEDGLAMPGSGIGSTRIGKIQEFADIDSKL
jgi:hypothetical protein